MDVEHIILWCGFLGTWLLVAGPIFQASLELKEQDLEVDRLREIKKSLPINKHVSVWWWLFPPAKIILEARHNRAYEMAYMQALSDTDRESVVNFDNKANGWLMVGGGAFLLALKETYDLCIYLHTWPYLFAIVSLVMLMICLWYTTLQNIRADQLKLGVFTRSRPGHKK